MPGPCAARAVIRELRGSPEILDPLCGKGFARKNTRIFGEPLSFPLPERSFMGLPPGFWFRWSEWQTMHSTGWSEARLLKRIGIGVRPYESFAHIPGETRGAYQAFKGGWAFLQISFLGRRRNVEDMEGMRNRGKASREPCRGTEATLLRLGGERRPPH